MVRRMWINQPSTLDRFHKLHGTNVLVSGDSSFVKVYFLSGDVISQQMPLLALSKGWKNG